MSLTVKFGSVIDDEQFRDLCRRNPDVPMERTSRGELLVLPPTGGDTGNRNSRLTGRLAVWSDSNDLGLAFDSSTLFKLPNQALRGPDASWIRRERWAALSSADQIRFPPLCPDFVVELMSPSSELAETQDKMREYLDNGTRLGWLLDPANRRVEIYRIHEKVEVLVNPAQLSGENVLPGFILDLGGIL